MANNFPAIRPTLLHDYAGMGVLPPDVTFTRASTSGGYYDGRTVVKAEENLILQSQTFGTSWILDNATVSSNTATAPDGTVTADTVVESATTSSHLIRQASVTLAIATYTASVYAKASTRSMLSIGFDGLNAWFNLSTGAVGTVEAGLTASISDAGSGWYRCIVTKAVTVANAKTFGLYVATTDNVLSYAGDGTSGIFIWGAQLEQRSTVTAYTPTTTQQITNYIPKMLFAAANVPVFDHNPTTGERLGLAIWEARTNIWTYSEFQVSSALSETAVTASQMFMPDGNYVNARRFLDNATNRIIYGRTVVASTAYTFSAFVKMLDGLVPAFGSSTGSNASNTFAIVISGAIANPLNYVIQNLGNGLYRVSGTATSGVSLLGNNGIIKYSTNNARGFDVTGFQLEVGSFATPYIPTVASTVARSADVAVMTGVNFTRWYRADEGSFVASALTANTAATGGIFSAEDGTANNRIQLRNNSSGVMSLTGVITGTAEVSLTNGSFAANVYKIGSATYKVNDYAASCDGAAVSTDTIARVPIVDRLVIGSGTSQNWMNGYIKSLQYYPARLTNAQLQAVTA